MSILPRPPEDPAADPLPCHLLALARDRDAVEAVLEAGRSGLPEPAPVSLLHAVPEPSAHPEHGDELEPRDVVGTAGPAPVAVAGAIAAQSHDAVASAATRLLGGFERTTGIGIVEALDAGEVLVVLHTPDGISAREALGPLVEAPVRMLCFLDDDGEALTAPIPVTAAEQAS